jgi:hypothetical protein
MKRHLLLMNLVHRQAVAMRCMPPMHPDAGSTVPHVHPLNLPTTKNWTVLLREPRDCQKCMLLDATASLPPPGGTVLPPVPGAVL